MTKKYILILSTLLLSCTYVQAQGVNFVEGSLQSVLKQAKKENKQVFIDCYTSWCVPCANMARNIFPQKVCGDYFNQHFICTKFDMEKGEGLKLQNTFKCIVYPTFLILNADGKEITRLTGASLTGEAFVEKVKEALDPTNSSDSLKAKYEANKCMQTGLPYAKVMYDKGYNIAEILEDIYLHSQEYDRYNSEFLIYYLSATDFRTPMFDRLLLDKHMWNSRLGCETVDKMIFDTYRKTMYLVAAGRPHQLTVDDVRKAAMITSMLALHEHGSERYLPMVALYVISKDWDRFIDTYIRRIFPMAEDSYKGILLGFLTQYYPQFSPIQKGVIDKALRRIAQNRDYDKRTTEAFITNLHK